MAICATYQVSSLAGTITLTYTNTAPASCTGLVLLNKTEYENYQSLATAVSEPFDYAEATAIFSFFFAFTVGVWVVAKNIGLILEAVRRW